MFTDNSNLIQKQTFIGDCTIKLVQKVQSKYFYYSFILHNIPDDLKKHNIKNRFASNFCFLKLCRYDNMSNTYKEFNYKQYTYTILDNMIECPVTNDPYLNNCFGYTVAHKNFTKEIVKCKYNYLFSHKRLGTCNVAYMIILI